MKIIGLTGGIASGKTTVSKILQNLGAIIIDADKVAREVVEAGKPALLDIVDYFGEEVLWSNGDLNRKKLGTIVFNNPYALEKLNSITHPRIFEEIKKRINYLKQNDDNPVIIIDAALLIETELKDMVEEIWLVTIPKALQKQRLMERDDLTIDEANNRIATQLSMEEKLQYADKLINNSGSLQELEKQVKELWGMIHKR
ncbi:dephospho-CoA kinase [Natronincola ferrireducens]|uniref:Dephospho-CoA kinase n=1 Tax=Natronincola ferrireducens TaxID=393762 RepID=A0A1G9A8L5_9FIRM|nr:dephospho-CoA kinase [Natronincola ferrireducens]SDK23696.1 dephospho-CoA kinase [Natronincola ferrireducens]